MSTAIQALPQSARLAGRCGALLPLALLTFIASAFVLPSGPAYSLVFYALVLLPALAATADMPLLRQPGSMIGGLLILWSGLTLIWGHDDGHRSMHFAIDSVMTMVFLAAMLGGLNTAEQRTRLATVLIWVGAGNAALSLVMGFAFPQHTDRLHGWGATSHPILGASVMSVCYLTALNRTLTQRRLWGAHLAAAVVMAFFVLMTESRGPLIAVSSATLFLCVAGPWRWRALGTLAGAVAVYRLLPQGLRDHQTALLVERGSSHRFEIWRHTLDEIFQRPITGHGLAANLDMPGGVTFPHDLYLSVLFYSGVVGFVLFVALAGWVTWQLWRTRVAADTAVPGKNRADWLWLVALWMNTLLCGLTDLGQITKGPGPLWFIFWLPVGLVLAAPYARPAWVSRSATA